ncbi:MAG: hypothetical protein KM310_10285 [Clostridiales bacterium]|nr:hypothetical protein [Clostridiales bacterium]
MRTLKVLLLIAVVVAVVAAGWHMLPREQAKVVAEPIQRLLPAPQPEIAGMDITFDVDREAGEVRVTQMIRLKSPRPGVEAVADSYSIPVLAGARDIALNGEAVAEEAADGTVTLEDVRVPPTQLAIRLSYRLPLGELPATYTLTPPEAVPNIFFRPVKAEAKTLARLNLTYDDTHIVRTQGKDGVFFQVKDAAAGKPIEVALEEITPIAGIRGKVYEIRQLRTTIFWYTDEHRVGVHQTMFVENIGDELLKELREVPVFDRTTKAWLGKGWDDPPVTKLRVYNAYGNSYRVVDVPLEAPLAPGEKTVVDFYYDVPAQYANEKLVWWDRPATDFQWFAASNKMKWFRPLGPLERTPEADGGEWLYWRVTADGPFKITLGCEGCQVVGPPALPSAPSPVGP